MDWGLEGDVSGFSTELSTAFVDNRENPHGGTVWSEAGRRKEDGGQGAGGGDGAVLLSAVHRPGEVVGVGLLSAVSHGDLAVVHVH